MPLVMERVEACRRHRAASRRGATNRLAGSSALFGEIRQPGAKYLVVPQIFSERRPYVPMGFLGRRTIAGDKLFTVAGAGLYHFGILASCVHMAWARAVCGRAEARYSYSAAIAYNNFPWPGAADGQAARIGRLAQGVLDARALHPGRTMGDLYDPAAMPPELSKAHRALDGAVMRLYGFRKDAPEAEVVAGLMGMHAELAAARG